MEMYMRFQNIFKQKCTEMDKKIAITCYTELKNIEEISYRDLLYSCLLYTSPSPRD